MVDQIEKNKIDLKYQISSNLGLKLLGLAVSIPIGLAGISFFREKIVLFIELGIYSSVTLLLLSFIFLYKSWKYLNKLDELKD